MDALEPRAAPAPAPAPAAASSPKARHTWVDILIVGSVLLLAALIGRQILTQRAGATFSDDDPTPRPRLNAPFITSADAVVDKMVELAQLTNEDVVYDLGCGDGRIIITAAMHSRCRGVGFDIDPERVAEARKNVELHGVGRLVTIKEEDIFRVDLSKANVAVMYLLPWMMQRLTPQFEEMLPGSRIVSHDFYIEGVEPERVAVVQADASSSPHFVFMYTVPLRWNPDMPNKPPMQGLADRADAERAAKKKTNDAPNGDKEAAAAETVAPNSVHP